MIFLDLLASTVSNMTNQLYLSRRFDWIVYCYCDQVLFMMSLFEMNKYCQKNYLYMY